MVVKAGYKRTEVGIIPNDWDVKQWGEVVTDCSSGGTPSRENPEFFKGDVKWVSSGELNHNVIRDTIEHISINAVKRKTFGFILPVRFSWQLRGLRRQALGELAEFSNPSDHKPIMHGDIPIT